MTKFKLILLLVISLASKLTTADEGLFESEIRNPQLIPLANKLNLKENTLFQGSTHLNSNNNVLRFENAQVKDSFQKEQAKLMSFKKPTSTESESKVEVARRLNNSLRMNRLQMIENVQELGVPKMLASYMRSKNRNELSKLSRANLLPEELSTIKKNAKIAEIPSFLKVNNHQRLLHKLEDESDSQITAKTNDNIRTLSGNNRDKKYFQSIEYTTNRMNNSLRNNRLKLAKSSDLTDVPTVLAMYIRKKMENERSQLVNRGIIPEDYEETVTEAPTLRPSPRANKPRARVQSPKVVDEYENDEEEEEEEEEEEDYELTTTKKSPLKPNFVVVIDEKKAPKQRVSNQPKIKVKAPEPEYETYEYDVKPKNRGQANKNNKALNNPNRRNQVKVNKQKPKPVVELEEYYDEEEVTTTTQAPTTTTTTATTTTRAPRRRYNPRGNPSSRGQSRRRVKPIEESAYSSEEETTSKQSRLNQGYKHKTFRRTTVTPELAVETSTEAVVPEAATSTVVEETTVSSIEGPTTVAASTPEPVLVVEKVTEPETTNIAPVEETTTTESVVVVETTTAPAPVETTFQTVQDENNRNLKAKMKLKQPQRVIVDKISSQSNDEKVPRINANQARQGSTPRIAQENNRNSRPRLNANSARQKISPTPVRKLVNQQSDNMQSKDRFNNPFNRIRLTPLAARYHPINY